MNRLPGMKMAALAVWLLSAVLVVAASQPHGAAIDQHLGHTAQVDGRRAGQRQIHKDATRATETASLAHTSNRAVNRLQSRLRSRIARSYNPRVNAISPFKIAGGKKTG